MRSYKFVNDLTGWLVFAVATVVFLLTLEPTGSFWDCGEFVACSYKLLVPHPPGAPAFLLLGRIFSLFAGGNPAKIGVWVNALSGLSSSFTILFLFWTITMMGRKLLVGLKGEPTGAQTLLLMGAGAVGALGFAFTDSFWFSAEEAEVYAMSAFCTAFVVWAMLKWERVEEEPDSDRWLILIAYVVGLSIGVHLLNLLAIPALAFIYYFKRQKVTMRGGLIAFVISGIIILSILVGIIPGLPTLAGWFELFFVNSIGLPFSSGLWIFLVLLLGGIWYGFRRSFQTGSQLLNTAMLSFVFILIGYSSYLIVPIRSSYRPTINENAPENVLSFVSYLKREQYGDRPILYGPQYSAEPISQEAGDSIYIPNVRTGKYEGVDRKLVTEYDARDKVLLPRIYSNQPAHLEEYRKWGVNIPYQPTANPETGRPQYPKPTFGENMGFLFGYQLNHMYWRYFGWNFVGREGDVQQSGVLWPGEDSKTVRAALPERVAESKARNNFWALPLLLGILGLIYQIRKDNRDALIVGLLFFFTGIAIALYLNQPPIEPRERDYTFAGSFYAFGIWMGIGVIALADLLGRFIKSVPARAALATGLGALVPFVLIADGWDDHNRSGRYNSVDSARNLLESCAPNAIIFTNGDNDTFPLWYAQEVEGIRPDVRVSVLSYLNTDWYIDQMRRPSYTNTPLITTLDSTNYRQGTNDYLTYQPIAQVANGIDLKQFIGLVKQNYPALVVPTQVGKPLMSFPTKKFFLDIDTAAVWNSGIIPTDRRAQLVPRMEWTIKGNLMEKKNLIILDMIQANQWKRPIYFSTTVNTADFMGLLPYFQLEGLAYRLLPCKNPTADPRQNGFVAREIMHRNMMTKFQFRGLDNPRIFNDENGLRFPANSRDKLSILAESHLAAGDTVRAKQVLAAAFRWMPDAAVPYDYYTPQFIAPLVEVGDRARANQIMDVMGDRAVKSLTYYQSHDTRQLFDNEARMSIIVLQNLAIAAQQIGDQARAAKFQQLFTQFYNPNGG
ncbi:MAG: DUF2723 domain-containing protein [Hymenobacteraceae bacterium]|nr:DUF2723 domain-containing protein [Hymenobacteraceae bacterium]